MNPAEAFHRDIRDDEVRGKQLGGFYQLIPVADASHYIEFRLQQLMHAFEQVAIVVCQHYSRLLHIFLCKRLDASSVTCIHRLIEYLAFTPKKQLGALLGLRSKVMGVPNRRAIRYRGRRHTGSTRLSSALQSFP